MAPRGILFDKDGTLLDYHETWMPANRAVAHALSGGDAALALHLLTIGGWDAETDRVGSGTPLAAGDLQDIAVLWHPYLPAGDTRSVDDIVAFLDTGFPDNMVPTAVCDLGPLLDELAGQLGLCLGVATADSVNGLNRSLEPFGILDRFRFAAGFDSGHGRKPEPGMVHAFCALCGVQPGEVIVVGDNRHDIDMARAAGARAVGVLTGTSDAGQLMDAGAEAVLASISRLPEYCRDARI
ncbi:HAD family hydrolase [Rhodospirillaceae bacterium KN72]|uniref:phosphoglycolate phosphatase n=1 Tax=Pacificispira spongiicola TaxID=2729598 RepID=A0A7Y0DZW7_9PROT|nr:HAD family hydrolase [Pacificispira spongiicola]NMM44665.1 HAD family hydrolase [Pacificispira spongiicola]